MIKILCKISSNIENLDFFFDFQTKKKERFFLILPKFQGIRLDIQFYNSESGDCQNFKVGPISDEYYVGSCLGPGVPEVSLFSFDGGKERVLDNNVNLTAKVNDTRLPVVKYRTWKNGIDFQTTKSTRHAQKRSEYFLNNILAK